MIHPIYGIKQNNYNSKRNNIVFRSSDREVCSEENSNRILYRNYTRLFRSDMNWDMLVQYISKDEKPKKIYCYACSDGSEPYSLALAIIMKLGYKEAKKYFPIIAKDRDDYIIEKAKSGFINVTEDDKLRLMSIRNFPIKKFLTETNLSAENDRYSIYKINDILKECIIFSTGDLIEDAKSLDFDNSILMFRNVWPYLDAQEQIKLIKTLSNKFNKSSSLVIGNYDYSGYNWKANYINGEVTTFNERLSDNGLHLVKPLIYEKRNIRNPINLIQILYAHIAQQTQFIKYKIKQKKSNID